MRCLSKVSSRPDRFVHREDGAATIEAVLWLPFFLLLFALLADISMIFHSQSRILRVVQNANRNMSVGRLVTEQETESFVISQLSALSNSTQANTVLSSDGLITTTVSIPLTDIDMFGVTRAFAASRLTVRAEHLREN